MDSFAAGGAALARLPSFLYGTAWKEDDTKLLVLAALEAGFRGIDTANQRRHYHEAAVGQALAEAFTEGRVERDELFLQTKFTYVAGQDHRLPYDPEAAPAEQVVQSFASSLEHLGVDAIDAYLLHGPSARVGLSPVDLEVWTAMEALHADGRARYLGVSNVSAAQLEELCARARVPPAFVQNRCFAATGWDQRVRELCGERDIVYQGFSLLTANPQVLGHPLLHELARRQERSPAQVVFRFCQQVGMLPLTGTSDPGHISEDLACDELDLTSEDLRLVEGLGLDGA